MEFHTTIKYAKFINENRFSWSESTGNAISVYFLKLCKNFKNFQKIFIGLNKTRIKGCFAAQMRGATAQWST